ncbi:MAG: hypothetical protein RR393_07310 [Bacteroidales bacterium]
MKFQTAIVCFILFLFVYIPVLGQDHNFASRVEIDVLANDMPYTVLPLGKMGVLLVMNQNDLISKDPLRYVLFYDENLSRRWVASLIIDPVYNFISYKKEEDSVRFILTSLPDKYTDENFLEISICLADGMYNKRFYSAPMDGKWEILSMQIYDKYWLFLARSKSEYGWYRYDYSIDSLDYHPLYADKDYQWCSVQFDTNYHRVYTVFRDVALKKKSLFLCANDTLGASIYKEEIFPVGEDLRLIDAKVQVMGPDKVLLAGSVNMDREKQEKSTYDRGTQTMGIFAAVCQNGKRISFYAKPYLDFPNLDSLISTQALYDLQQAKARAKGRTIIPTYTTQIRVGLLGNEYYLLSEVYERVLTSTTQVSYDYFGRMVPYTQTYFEGFRYHDVFYSVFDSIGQNKRNLIFDIQQNKLYPTLTDYTQCASDTSGDYLYAYNMDGYIYFRTLSKNGLVSEIFNFRLNPMDKWDKVQNTWGNSLLPWYPGCFLSYGYEQILNNHYKGKNKRNVFYMNKLMIDKGEKL